MGLYCKGCTVIYRGLNFAVYPCTLPAAHPCTPSSELTSVPYPEFPPVPCQQLASVLHCTLPAVYSCTPLQSSPLYPARSPPCTLPAAHLCTPFQSSPLYPAPPPSFPFPGEIGCLKTGHWCKNRLGTAAVEDKVLVTSIACGLPAVELFPITDLPCIVSYCVSLLRWLS